MVRQGSNRSLLYVTFDHNRYQIKGEKNSWAQWSLKVPLPLISQMNGERIVETQVN